MFQQKILKNSIKDKKFKITKTVKSNNKLSQHIKEYVSSNCQKSLTAFLQPQHRRASVDNCFMKINDEQPQNSVNLSYKKVPIIKIQSQLNQKLENYLKMPQKKVSKWKRAKQMINKIRTKSNFAQNIPIKKYLQNNLLQFQIQQTTPTCKNIDIFRILKQREIFNSQSKQTKQTQSKQEEKQKYETNFKFNSMPYTFSYTGSIIPISQNINFSYKNKQKQNIIEVSTKVLKNDNGLKIESDNKKIIRFKNNKKKRNSLIQTQEFKNLEFIENGSTQFIKNFYNIKLNNCIQNNQKLKSKSQLSKFKSHSEHHTSNNKIQRKINNIKRVEDSKFQIKLKFLKNQK